MQGRKGPFQRLIQDATLKHQRIMGLAKQHRRHEIRLKLIGKALVLLFDLCPHKPVVRALQVTAKLANDRQDAHDDQVQRQTKTSHIGNGQIKTNDHSGQIPLFDQLDRDPRQDHT